MSRFPTAGHLASWAGRCPGQRESAGKRGSATPRKGSPWLADVLTECAWAAVKTKGTYLSAYYRQLMRRQGKQKAVMALTHKILVIAWNLLSTGALYDDPGAAAVRTSTTEQQRRRRSTNSKPSASPSPSRHIQIPARLERTGCGIFGAGAVPTGADADPSRRSARPAYDSLTGASSNR
jgi:Transposase IS116/IS110/IS902 family